MSQNENHCGYAFALPRVIAKLFGAKARRAEWSAAEAYGVGVLVFGIACVFCARQALLLVRPWPGRIFALLALPFAVWVGFLVLYYLVSLLIRLLRRLQVYKPTNDALQHIVITLLTTLIALHFLRDPIGWISSLGVCWFLLLGSNVFCIFFETLLDEP